jgi:hypothetical protein
MSRREVAFSCLGFSEPCEAGSGTHKRSPYGLRSASRGLQIDLLQSTRFERHVLSSAIFEVAQ